jgi:histidine ammonia-lyase
MVWFLAFLSEAVFPLAVIFHLYVLELIYVQCITYLLASQLSYIAASICGHPDIKVFDTASSTILSAQEAISKYNLEKITLAAKEGLGLVNGTAVSCAAGTLALYQAESLAVMTQTVTALTTEARKSYLALRFAKQN